MVNAAGDAGNACQRISISRLKKGLTSAQSDNKLSLSNTHMGLPLLRKIRTSSLISLAFSAVHESLTAS